MNVESGEVEYASQIFPLFSIADGYPKIDEGVRRVFPRADFQLHVIHASSNFEAETRESDKLQIDRELKRVFTADTKEDALARLSLFKVQWSKKYPGRYTIRRRR